jgi:hypothetical protein
MSKKYSIFHLEGGIGKHIAATAVAKCIKNNYPDRELFVVCAYPSPFVNLEYVDKVYLIGNTPYFYQDFVKGKDILLFRHEPYFTTEHVKGESRLIENWCNLYGLKYSGETPELIFNMREKQLGMSLWEVEKPMLLLHTAGGIFGNENDLPYKWTRDMPANVINTVVEEFSSEYDIFQITRPGAWTIPGAKVVDKRYSVVELMSILFRSSKRLLIDSSVQHGAAALGLSSTVLWIGTNPDIFGYDLHDNIQAVQKPDFKLPDSYLFDYNFEGITHECPYKDESEMFNVDEIINSVKKQ